MHLLTAPSGGGEDQFHTVQILDLHSETGILPAALCVSFLQTDSCFLLSLTSSSSSSFCCRVRPPFGRQGRSRDVGQLVLRGEQRLHGDWLLPPPQIVLMGTRRTPARQRERSLWKYWTQVRSKTRPVLFRLGITFL